MEATTLDEHLQLVCARPFGKYQYFVTWKGSVIWKGRITKSLQRARMRFHEAIPRIKKEIEKHETGN